MSTRPIEGAPPPNKGCAGPTTADQERAVDKLKGKDAVGTMGEVAATAAGVAGGTAAAGAIAGVAGATTLLGSSTLGTLLGGVFVTTTPVGWVVGCAVVGGAAGYAIAKVVRSAGRQDERRKALTERLRKRLESIRNRTAAKPELEALQLQLDVAVQRGCIPQARAAAMLLLVEEGKISTDVAHTRVRALLDELPRPR